MGENCWKCMGVGGWHDCGEDTCCCLAPEDEDGEFWNECDECDGLGELVTEVRGERYVTSMR